MTNYFKEALEAASKRMGVSCRKLNPVLWNKIYSEEGDCQNRKNKYQLLKTGRKKEFNKAISIIQIVCKELGITPNDFFKWK